MPALVAYWLKDKQKVWYSIVVFNVPVDTYDITCHMTQPCHSTEGWLLVNQVKGQSHQAQLTKR